MRTTSQHHLATPKPPTTCNPTGGTRFIGQYLARQVVEQGHEVTLFTRGKSPITQQIPDDTDASYAQFKGAVRHIAGDRMEFDAVKEKLSKEKFEIVYDINGREGAEVSGSKAPRDRLVTCQSDLGQASD